MALTARQRRFVAEYVRDFNGRHAAVRAGYTEHSALHNVSQLMRRPEVRAAVERAIAEEERRILFDGYHVIAALMCVAFSDIRAYLEPGPDGTVRLKPLAALCPSETAAIADYAPATKRRGPVLRLRSKRQALRALARHVGLHERRHAIDPLLLVAEGERVRTRLFAAAGRDPAEFLPPPEEE
jgi:phage terminase small subunit